MNPKVVVTIAVFNEAKTIDSVLQEVPQDIDVIIVDDGSTDNTVSIAEAFGVRVVKHPVNLGQGMALITGFRAALMHDYDLIVEMDGDGQHDPHDIPRFVTTLQETGCDLVVGSRRLGSSYRGEPFFRRTFLPTLTNVINFFTGYHLTDSMCGFRAFRASSLRRCHSVLDETSGRQYVAAEWFIKFSKVGLTVAEIPIHLKRRRHGASYKGLVRYGWGVARSIVRGVMWENVMKK
jgi:glycosyltransferase involved in cell wall biosynthesis